MDFYFELAKVLALGNHLPRLRTYLEGEHMETPENPEADAYFESNFVTCDMCKEWVHQNDTDEILGATVCPACYQQTQADLDEADYRTWENNYD